VGSGGNNFVDSQSGTFITTISVNTTVEWQWVAGSHTTTSGDCIPAPCTPNLIWDSGPQPQSPPFTFTHTFGSNTAGMTFNYYCRVHDAMMQGVVSVLP
jgi:plastocyanin